MLLSGKLGVYLDSEQIRCLYQSNSKLCDPSLWKIGGELGLVAEYKLISEYFRNM